MTKTKSTKQRPVETFRDGAIKAAIWRNESDNGDFFSVTFCRTFRDADGKLKDTGSFSGSQLLRLAHLASKAYERAGKLACDARAQDQAEPENDQD